jgi:hypothetical protein
MIISTRIWKRPATNRTGWMRNKLNMRPTGGAEIFPIATADGAAARPATWWIKPIHQPIQALGERSVTGGCHDSATRQNYSQSSTEPESLRDLSSGRDRLRIDDQRLTGHLWRLGQPEKLQKCRRHVDRGSFLEPASLAFLIDQDHRDPVDRMGGVRHSCIIVD